jgi:hypothetical protein
VRKSVSSAWQSPVVALAAAACLTVPFEAEVANNMAEANQDSHVRTISTPYALTDLGSFISAVSSAFGQLAIGTTLAVPPYTTTYPAGYNTSPIGSTTTPKPPTVTTPTTAAGGCVADAACNPYISLFGNGANNNVASGIFLAIGSPLTAIQMEINGQGNAVPSMFELTFETLLGDLENYPGSALATLEDAFSTSIAALGDPTSTLDLGSLTGLLGDLTDGVTSPTTLLSDITGAGGSTSALTGLLSGLGGGTGGLTSLLSTLSSLTSGLSSLSSLASGLGSLGTIGTDIESAIGSLGLGSIGVGSLGALAPATSSTVTPAVTSSTTLNTPDVKTTTTPSKTGSTTGSNPLSGIIGAITNTHTNTGTPGTDKTKSVGNETTPTSNVLNSSTKLGGGLGGTTTPTGHGKHKS